MEDATSERDIRPLPSRLGASATENTATANPRPRKRRRDDSWEMGYPAGGPQLPAEGLYTISQDLSDGDDSETAPTHDHDFASHDTKTAVQPASRYFAHRQPDYNSRRVHSQALPSFRELLAQGGRPPPSARSLNWGPYPSRQPSSQAGPSRPAPPVAGPSRVEQPVAIYRTKPRKSLVDLARIRHELGEGMDWT
jgi:hypothetical protein